MPRLPAYSRSGKDGNGLPEWSQSRPCNYVYISRKPQPCLSRLNGMGGELHIPHNLWTGKCPVSLALEGLPLKAGPCLPAGRNGHNIKEAPYREATSFTLVSGLACEAPSFKDQIKNDREDFWIWDDR